MANTPLQVVVALSATAFLGVRHGLDCDHFAALSDLVSMERKPGHSIQLGLAYIAGHSLVISLLGSMAICLQYALPSAVDRWMERVVGVTLVVLSGYIVVTLLRTRNHSQFHSRSRVMLLTDSALWVYNHFRQWAGIQGQTRAGAERWLYVQIQFYHWLDPRVWSGNPNPAYSLLRGGKTWWDRLGPCGTRNLEVENLV